MRALRWISPALAPALFAALFGFVSDARAEPLVRSGIGLAACAKVAADLKPAEGLNHLPNALMFYWVQGYLSAANIHLLNEYNDYIDVGVIDADTILPMIVKYCKANPDKRPVNGIDKYVTDADKINVKESDAFDPWDH